MHLLRKLEMLAFLLAAPVMVHALGPHEILLIVNGNSPASREVANWYAFHRQVPPANVVYLPLGREMLLPRAEMTANDFTRHIWEPALQAMKERGIEDHILAWIYSCDIPIRVVNSPSVSITGLTFLRNQWPDLKLIDQGVWQSPLFSGPDQPGGRKGTTFSLDAYLRALGNEVMPLPSGMLGYSGARGNSVEEIIASLKRGIRSDASASPHAGVWLIKTGDVRSRCRDWQFQDAAIGMGGEAASVYVTEGVFPKEGPVEGVTVGLPWVDTAAMSGMWVSGGLADQLTSAGAFFHHYDQTKLSAWVRDGVTGVSGTICEPFAIWSKFPNARLHEHYRAGCTLLESYVQAVRCPLQLLVLGDPLATPHAQRVAIKLNIEPLAEPGQPVSFSIGLDPVKEPVRFMALLDGRRVYGGGDPQFSFDAELLAGGTHRLRAVAYIGSNITHQAFIEKFVKWDPASSAPVFSDLPVVQTMDCLRPVALPVTVVPERGSAGFLANGHKIPITLSAGSARADFTRLGPGPLMVQPYLENEEGGVALADPVAVNLVEQNRAALPVIDPPRQGDDGVWQVSGRVSDPDGDDVLGRWVRELPLLVRSSDLHPRLRVSKGSLTPGAGGVGLAMETQDPSDLTCVRYAYEGRPGLIEAVVRFAPTDGIPVKHPVVGLIYDFSGEGRFRFAGIYGAESAILCAEFENGKPVDEFFSRGLPLEPGRSYTISLERGDMTTLLKLDGRVLAELPPQNFGKWGFAGGGGRVTLERLLIGGEAFRGDSGREDFDPGVLPGARLYLRAQDAYSFAEREVVVPE